MRNSLSTESLRGANGPKSLWALIPQHGVKFVAVLLVLFGGYVYFFANKAPLENGLPVIVAHGNRPASLAVGGSNHPVNKAPGTKPVRISKGEPRPDLEGWMETHEKYVREAKAARADKVCLLKLFSSFQLDIALKGYDLQWVLQVQSQNYDLDLTLFVSQICLFTCSPYSPFLSLNPTASVFTNS